LLHSPLLASPFLAALNGFTSPSRGARPGTSRTTAPPGSEGMTTPSRPPRAPDHELDLSLISTPLGGSSPFAALQQQAGLATAAAQLGSTSVLGISAEEVQQMVDSMLVTCYGASPAAAAQRMFMGGSPHPAAAAAAAIAAGGTMGPDLMSLLCTENLEDAPRSASKRCAHRPSPNRGHVSPHLMASLNRMAGGARDKSSTPPEKKKVVQKLNFDSNPVSMLTTPAPNTPHPDSKAASTSSPSPLTMPGPIKLEAGEPETPPVDTASKRLSTGAAVQRQAVVPKAVMRTDLTGPAGALHSTTPPQQPKGGPAAAKTPQEPPAAHVSSSSKKVKASPAVATPVVQAAGGPAPAGPKRCNCKNSKCLKLYCDCFKTGTYCNGCMCRDCKNTEEHESIVKSTVEQIKQRNPDAFAHKIAGDAHKGKVQHRTGCNCKRSGCRKKYCECFQAGVMCGDSCKCANCKNQLDHPEVQAEMAQAGAASTLPPHLLLAAQGAIPPQGAVLPATSSPQLASPGAGTHVFTGMAGGALPGHTAQKFLDAFEPLQHPAAPAATASSKSKKRKSAHDMAMEAAQLVQAQVAAAMMGQAALAPAPAPAPASQPPASQPAPKRSRSKKQSAAVKTT